MSRQVAEIDNEYIKKIRKNVSSFISEQAEKFDGNGVRVLDIAPQDHEGAAPYFKTATVDTLDIDPTSGATYIADLCATNTGLIPSESYDIVVCTEVIEHTTQPFNAIKEIRRVLKKDGIVLLSSPFGFRIHGPLPDCWRISEHGWRALLEKFVNVEINSLEDSERFLMPIHYTVVAKK